MKTKDLREPIATWWGINSYRVELQPVQVVAFTEHFITHIEKDAWNGDCRERRERRDDYFPTFEEAKAEAIKRAQSKVDRAKEELQRLRSTLGQWESLRKPEQP